MNSIHSIYTTYIEPVRNINLHPELDIQHQLPNEIEDLRNIIFYGPCGTGKYTQSLNAVSKYSPSKLKYEKKLNVEFNKDIYVIKISDIHYEVDFGLLGCNSKQLWHEIYNHVVDIISTRSVKTGIILCKNFHIINKDLLDILYSYMQTNNSKIKIRFMIVTDEISFINKNILNCCQIFRVKRPTKKQYNLIIKNNNKNIWKSCPLKLLGSEMPVDDINNIKDIPNKHKICEKICEKILGHMRTTNINLVMFREILYELLVYNISIYDTVWYIIKSLILCGDINERNAQNIVMKTYEFIKYYNNNYRPIFHLENYFLFLTEVAIKSI